MSDIVVKNISKRFEDNVVFDNFSCTFKENTISCLESPSGVGKTTLLNMITGIYTPDEGTIKGVPKKLAVVFQENRLCEDFTAISNVKIVTKDSMTKEEITAHLKELHIEDLKNPVRKFSGGMQRRVAIARAICYDADCIILDEPFKGLDPALKKDVMDYIIKYTKGKTVICVTHDHSDTEYFGANLIII